MKLGAKTAGIVIDAWKLEIFRRHLDGANFSHTQHPGLSEGTLILKVKADRVARLQRVVERAQLECRSTPPTTKREES
ncbi:hypothetical protein [Novosphingobium resinovorum]|uniref:Uncharacterized protein n=1 Tax=Novosphingobium resinovorum TaxID=158500 RepID=A0A1D8A562_9SPHN|nr:hypothetical protein [Novosphingobium resinovorum]AOR77241.1 hypothetical protein BES08_11120 [Novosphingobium resinovorum]